MMEKSLWVTNIVLAVMVVLLSAMLLSVYVRRPVLAQSEGEVGSIIAIAGQSRPRDDEPLFLIDTKNQVLMAYEYQIQTNWFCLRGVRRTEYDFTDNDMMYAPIGRPPNMGPRVAEVKTLIEKAAQK